MLALNTTSDLVASYISFGHKVMELWAGTVFTPLGRAFNLTDHIYKIVLCTDNRK